MVTMARFANVVVLGLSTVVSKIPEDKLIPFTWYNGIGRNSFVGYWDGCYFNTFERFFNGIRHKREGYYDADGGTFTPLRMIRVMNNFRAVQKILLPRNLDRRVKLSEDDRAAIRSLYKDGFSIRAIARALPKISRRMIQFILFPERAKHNSELFKARRKDGRYYDKKKHTKAIKSLRRYKTEKLGAELY